MMRRMDIRLSFPLMATDTSCVTHVLRTVLFRLVGHRGGRLRKHREEMPFSCWEEDGDEDAASEKISESVPNGHRPHPCCVLLSVNFGSPALTGKAMPAFDWLTDSPASSAGTGVGFYPWRAG